MIQIEPTPNPNSLKFLSEKTISAIGTEEFQKDNIEDLSNEFITILKSKRDELIFKLKLTGSEETEILQNRIEVLEKKINKLEKNLKKKKTKKAKK